MAQPGLTGLPVEECIQELREALADHGIAVLQAEPGAGKSTVVPLRLLDEPWLGGGRIVMLEPRRLAARATARRMAFLLGEQVGATVGYRTRDESKVSRSTRIEVVTEAILTRRLQHDASLNGVGLVIFDEVHERNLQSDLALALTLDVRHGLRSELAVLTMSATLDVERIAALLGGPDAAPAPIITSRGRQYPVELRWLPRDPRRRDAEAAAAVVRAALRDPGDVLVFLAGAADIRRVAALLSSDGSLPPDVDVRPLFGALSSQDQDAALAPSPTGRRRVVLSTDIAETSLTVDGVRVVIDTGTVRRPEFDHRSGLTRLHTGANSQASADQRSGRAGRTEPGIAYRLWSRSEHAARRPFAEPEIRTADLTGLALELAMWGAAAGELAFLDPPPTRRLADAVELLRRLGALDVSGRTTDTGRAMADLPLHPRLAHLVVRGHADGHGWLACVIAALLEERDAMRGHPSEVPVDLETRVRLLLGEREQAPGVDRGALATARRRAGELARRAGIDRSDPAGGNDLDACGALLALAYPDRIAQALGGVWFRMRNGQRVTMPSGDPMCGEAFVVVAEVGPASGPTANRPTGRGDGAPQDQIRIAGAVTRDDLEMIAGDDVEDTTRLVWNTERDELEEQRERRVGSVVLSSSSTRPTPNEATTRALIDHVREVGLDALSWTSGARALQERGGFAYRTIGEPWPDLCAAALLDDLEDWLTPLLYDASRRSDIGDIDVTAMLRSRLGHHLVRELDQVVPATVTVGSRRAVRVDYHTDPPSITVRAQDLYGVNTHPTLAEGRMPLAIHVLSPAGRVVQVTSDLPGFWAGTWSEVRKELAGRYPRHDWPADPSTASPVTKRQPRK